jgi:superfamily II DNA/RNA helicase
VCYDIPWNPTRLIQRLGRVNRAGSPFKEVFVHHFFPTEKGASVVDPKAVALNKLHLIHRALGEVQTAEK